MLIQFSVENFLSIKDNVVLSLLASKDNEHPEHLIVDGNKKHLKSAVIYGANASGKSNVLNAFWFMVNYVLTSHNQQLHKTIERSPFKFDRETPSHHKWHPICVWLFCNRQSCYRRISVLLSQWQAGTHF